MGALKFGDRREKGKGEGVEVRGPKGRKGLGAHWRKGVEGEGTGHCLRFTGFAQGRKRKRLQSQKKSFMDQTGGTKVDTSKKNHDQKKKTKNQK